MTAPSWLNNGALQGNAGSTSAVPALPATRTNGNLLIAWLRFTAAKTPITVDGGWTIGGVSRDAISWWAWRLVDGAENAPTFSWSGTAAWYARVEQITGNSTTTPWANHNNSCNADGTTSTITNTGITTTAASSLIFGMEMVVSSNHIPDVPTNYIGVDASFSDAYGSTRVFTETVATAGNASDAVSVAITAATWHCFLIEIPSKTSLVPQLSLEFGDGVSLATCTGQATVTGVLPTGRVNGDLMIAISAIETAGVAMSWAGAGWHVGDSVAATGVSATWAWAYVNGAEVAPVVSWSGNRNALIRIYCLSRVNTSNPIGAMSNNKGSGTTLSATEITTTKDNSRIVALLLAGAGSVPNPTGYVNFWFEGGSYIDRFTSETKLTSGASSDAISLTISSGIWSAFLIEILAKTFDPGASTFRLRMQLENNGDSISSASAALYVSKNGGAYQAVTTTSTGGVKSADAGSDSDDTTIFIPRLSLQ